MAPGASAVLDIISRQMESTCMNLRPSSGICFMMSSEPKIGSRYCHVAWHVSQLSSMSCSVCRVSSHTPDLCSKGLMKGLARMLWILTIWSSRIIWMSSKPTSVYVPVSLYALAWNSTPSQSTTILSSAFSRLFSFDALVLTFCTSSSLSMIFRFIRSLTLKVKAGSALNDAPTISKIISQWRSFRAGLASSSTSGSSCLKLSISSLRRSTTRSSLFWRPILYASMVLRSTSARMDSTSSSFTLPSVHTTTFCWKVASVVHTARRSRHTFSVITRLDKSSTGSLNSCWYLWNVSPCVRILAMLSCTLSSSSTTVGGSMSGSTKDGAVCRLTCVCMRSSFRVARPLISVLIMFCWRSSMYSFAASMPSKYVCTLSVNESSLTSSCVGTLTL
mmetsp:Transcript_2471/g.8791  ORF Transcript_2471/g.8791 Transcript_2471/m.8791 type:complete len:390 (-) Transcript_2471:1918-3087(-)